MLQTVIGKLKLQSVPRNEFVIRAGALAEEMYFIVKGCCRVQSAEGIELAVLKKGHNFGEMGLLDMQNPLRQASVVTITKCSLAVLTKDDFELICKNYPIFESKIAELVKKRKLANQQKDKDVKIINM